MAAEFGARVTISAVDRLSKVLDKVKAKFPALGSAARNASTAFDAASKSTAKFTLASQKAGEAMQNVGRKMTLGITLPAAAAAGFSIRAFAQYETALIGVGKTTNLSGAELEAMGARFRNMAKEIPVSVDELLQLGKTAAQLGVRGTPAITKFAETLGKLSRATNISGEEGATDLARFLTISKTDMNDVDRVGAALVALGNTSAATEGEILHFSTRLAGATALFGFSASQTLGYATAMRSVGIEAEAGSSAVQRALGDMNVAISKGGQKAAVLAKITGIPLDQLKDKFKENAAGVLLNFAEGLDRIGKRGGDVTEALKYFGMEGVRDFAVIGSLSKNTGMLAEKMQTAATGIKENTALNKEFAATLDSLDSKFQLTKNRANDLMISLGARLAPAVVWVLEKFDALLGFLERNPALATTLAVFVGILAVLGPIILAIGTLIVAVTSSITGWIIMNAVLGALGLTLKGIMISVLIATAKFIAIAAAIYLVYKAASSLTEWVGSFIGGWGILTDGIFLALEGMSKLVDKAKEYTGWGTTEAEQEQIDIEAARGRIAKNPLKAAGGALGGNNAKAQVNRDFATQTNNARVDVHVRAPQSTIVRGESQGGVLEINRGMIGAF